MMQSWTAFAHTGSPAGDGAESAWRVLRLERPAHEDLRPDEPSRGGASRRREASVGRRDAVVEEILGPAVLVAGGVCGAGADDRAVVAAVLVHTAPRSSQQISPGAQLSALEASRRGPRTQRDGRQHGNDAQKQRQVDGLDEVLVVAGGDVRSRSVC